MFKHETKICHWWKQVTFTLAVKILKLNKGRWLQMQLHFILSSRLMKPTIAYYVLSNKVRAAKFVHCSVYIVHYRADTVCVWVGHTRIRGWVPAFLKSLYHSGTNYLSLQMIQYSWKPEVQEYIIQLRKKMTVQLSK